MDILKLMFLLSVYFTIGIFLYHGLMFILLITFHVQSLVLTMDGVRSYYLYDPGLQYGLLTFSVYLTMVVESLQEVVFDVILALVIILTLREPKFSSSIRLYPSSEEAILSHNNTSVTNINEYKPYLLIIAGIVYIIGNSTYSYLSYTIRSGAYFNSITQSNSLQSLFMSFLVDSTIFVIFLVLFFLFISKLKIYPISEINALTKDSIKDSFKDWVFLILGVIIVTTFSFIILQMVGKKVYFDYPSYLLYIGGPFFYTGIFSMDIVLLLTNIIEVSFFTLIIPVLEIRLYKMRPNLIAK